MQRPRVHVAAQLSHDALQDEPLLHGRIAIAMPPVKLHRKKNVRSLRAPVRNKRSVRSALKVRIAKIHIGETMTR